jgi:hypothetical protein
VSELSELHLFRTGISADPGIHNLNHNPVFARTSFYRQINHEQEFVPYFASKVPFTHLLPQHCRIITRLRAAASQPRKYTFLFDSSESRGNKYASVSISHTIYLK